MKTDCLAANGVAVLISFLLLILPPVISAEETYSASLVSVETLDADPWSHRISVRIGNRVENLLVSPNTQLNNLQIVTTDGASVDHNSIAYAGIIESLPESWARVVIDGQFVSGTINAGNSSTHFSSEQTGFSTNSFGYGNQLLSPLTPPEVPTNKIPRKKALNASQDSLSAETALGDDELPDEPSSEQQFAEVVVPVNSPLIQTVGDVTRVARIGIVVDSLYQEAIGGRGLNNAISTLNSVDGLYREKFGLALMVDVVVLLTDEAAVPLNGTSLEENLSLFRDYRIKSELLPEDLSLVHLFTGADTGDNAVGLAFSGAACRTDGYDVSMSRPFLFPVELAAHEIGHNLGADHDDATPGCQNVVDHLMFSAINSNTTREFSSCSSDAIQTRLQQNTCYTDVINMGVDITQIESNQVLATVTNLDTSRAFPSATLYLDLINATVAEAPALCELDGPSKLICGIPATFAGDQHDLAVKLRQAPEEERTISMRLEPNGFFDLVDQNNSAELVLPGEPLPPAESGNELSSGEDTTQEPSPPVDSAPANISAVTTVATEDDSSGGGLFDQRLMSLLFLLCVFGQVRCRLATRATTRCNI